MNTDLKPPPARPMPDHLLEQRAQQLTTFAERDLAKRRRRPPRSRPYLRRPLILIPATVLTLAAAAFAYSLLRDDSGEALAGNVVCYEQATPYSSSLRTRFEREGAAGIVKGRPVRSPAGGCARLWRRGVLGPTRSVPPLVQCRDRSELVIVPGKTAGICGVIGLQPDKTDYAVRITEFNTIVKSTQADIKRSWTGRYSSQKRPLVGGLQYYRVVGNPAGSCTTSSGEIAKQMSDQLDQADLGYWSVRVGADPRRQYQADPSRCASGLEIQPVAKRVVILDAHVWDLAMDEIFWAKPTPGPTQSVNEDIGPQGDRAAVDVPVGPGAARERGASLDRLCSVEGYGEDAALAASQCAINRWVAGLSGPGHEDGSGGGIRDVGDRCVSIRKIVKLSQAALDRRGVNWRVVAQPNATSRGACIAANRRGYHAIEFSSESLQRKRRVITMKAILVDRDGQPRFDRPAP